MVSLHELTVGDRAQAWADAGFAVHDERLWLGSVGVHCAGDGAGHDRWTLRAAPLPEATIDGIATDTADTDAPVTETPHPNRSVGLDHVVVRSPDLDRTTEAFGAVGLDLRRIRDVPLDPPIQQRFFRFDNTIIELVGPPAASGGEPASIWGIAVVVDDIDATADLLGDACSAPKDAVQPGRRIATLRTERLGISMAVAFMTPHVRRPG